MPSEKESQLDGDWDWIRCQPGRWDPAVEDANTDLNVFWISSLNNRHVKLNMPQIRLLTFPSYHFPPTVLSIARLATPFPTC